MRWLWPLLCVVVLTALTQIGGLVYIAARLMLGLFRLHGLRRNAAFLAVLVALYTASTLWLVPPVAAIGGRVALPCAGEQLRVLPVLCALNRHYVSPGVAALTEALAADIDRQFPGTTTVALDGNLPFFDGFPLLPHLSHDDGLKLDLAYYYAETDGSYAPGVTRSPIGYWAFETPEPGEAADCPPVWLTGRWNMSALQPLFPGLPLEQERTKAALNWLIERGPNFGLERIFVEPYLVQRLGVSSELLGFQGCRAARHDDHIHIQIAPVVGGSSPPAPSPS